MKYSAMLLSVCIFFFAVASLANFAFADCPQADINGDCRVNLEDFVIMANQWLNEGIPEPQNMVFITVNDPGIATHEGFSGQISKYEITNAQYCQFLNSALIKKIITIDNKIVYSTDDPNRTQPYFQLYSPETPQSQIAYSDISRKFYVRTRDNHSMARHPVVMVSYFGAIGFCHFYGYHLPTEWQFQAIADFNGSFTYGCGTFIDHSMANYKNANPLNLTTTPYTVPVDYYPCYGYGICNMSGNVAEWVSPPVTDSNRNQNTQNTTSPVCGGSWSSSSSSCTVSAKYITNKTSFSSSVGFRPCR